VPLMMGAGAGPWHAAKTLECATASTVQRKRPDSIFAWVREDHFDVEPLDMEARCSPQSVASHTLYENADPFLITEPDGIIDSTASRYEALNDRPSPRNPRHDLQPVRIGETAALDRRVGQPFSQKLETELPFR